MTEHNYAAAREALGDLEKRNSQVQQLAQDFARQSLSSAGSETPFTAAPGSALDPNGDSFDARAWCTAMMNLQTESPPGLGIAFGDLNVHGFGSDTDFQKCVGNVWLELIGLARQTLGLGRKKHKVQILQGLEGLVESGEMLAVLGPPGSGCSTFLKTVSGETHGFHVDKGSSINYQGISAKQMAKDFRGEAIYTAETDIHFPKLTVAKTLYLAARARAPRDIPGGVSADQYAIHMRDVIMAMFGISHTKDTIVGNDFIRGVSGGERKRVSIAEACLSNAPLQCWDNSTRGLDSANAVEFCKTLRMQADINGTAACVSLYQAPQAAYNFFDKVLVLYKGRQIYFGPISEAKQYFQDMGFVCPDRQTDADFLTSMTSPIERIVRPGCVAPRTPDEFAARWKASPQRQDLLEKLENYNVKYAPEGEHLEKFQRSRRSRQARMQRVSSPYTLSYIQQIQLCLWRGWERLKADPSITISSLFGNTVVSLVIASIFYNLEVDTSTFFQRGALLFFAVLMNALGSGLEMLTLYAQRGIVEKHARYALYHPSAEAFSSMIMDLPYNILNSITSNMVLYFMTNLRREPGAFFFFVFTSFILTLCMSMFFRSMASLSRSLVQALPFSGVLLLALSMYTGFAIPTDYMLGWARWIAYVNPINYGFEALLINEFHDRDFPCVNYVPSGTDYHNAGQDNHVCSTVGSVPGQSFVNGDEYLESAYGYHAANKWRNIGIIFAYMFLLGAIYLVASDFITEKKSKGEILAFPRGHKALDKKDSSGDIEATSSDEHHNIAQGTDTPYDLSMIQRQTAIFTWKDVCFDIRVGKEERRILDHVDGWVKPGTLTAMMGVSGAGKTTLLDVLATRTTVGVISGEMLVDGKPRDESFQRKTGYAQQQDLHLGTATVREALEFSALLRQPAHVPRQEKLDYVSEVIKLLSMTEYADAVIGVPGEGLNVEQRKRLTIGVELAARPALLLFLDEPTSGLDSQTSWAILDLLDRLKQNGQAILCTIHQPSAMLFQRFDRLLFLQAGGRTVYFGDIGEGAHTLIDYFVRNGGHPCPADGNPAEWMLNVIGAAPGSRTDIDWFETWKKSPEHARVQSHLTELKLRGAELSVKAANGPGDDRASYREFAASFWTQLCLVQRRVFLQIWRSPTYIYSKALLCVLSALFVGFSLYQSPNTIQGVQNQMFGIFMLLTLFGQLIQQIMPHFVSQRDLYEARERPSKTYSWAAFMISNIVVELPWNTLMSVLMFFVWYYPTGMYHNAAPTEAYTLRGAQTWLMLWTFLMFSSTFAHLMIASFDAAENAGNLGNLLFLLCLLFCGVLATPEQLPGFWIFMYRVSPFTYLVGGMLSAGVSNAFITCAENEYLHFDPINETCGQYMQPYMSQLGGYLEDEAATSNCSFCPLQSTNVFLEGVSSSYEDYWRNFGIMWVFVGFNVLAACGLYWLTRVPRAKKPAT
ncbi:ABC-2 type transporter domain-containing protein [Sarocladium implicatum]|nr:ABC-2 type transporter domain-containing protein [Sarocladium implicatum]